MKKNNKIQKLETAICSKFPNVNICEVRDNKFGLRILGVVPSRDDFDNDHIVEWTEDGRATECGVDSRDFREVAWDCEEERPTYVTTKILLHNEAFDVNVTA